MVMLFASQVLVAAGVGVVGHVEDTGVVPSVSVQLSPAVGSSTVTLTLTGADVVPWLSLTVNSNVTTPTKPAAAL